MLINYRSRAPQCGVCDAFSDDLDKRHPISHAIDGSNRWWQSPTLHHGKEYERVSITLDLGQVRFYILFKTFCLFLRCNAERNLYIKKKMLVYR